MAFSDVFQTLTRVIGLYPSQEEEYDSPDDSVYEEPYAQEDAYQQPQEEPPYEPPVYESGYGDSGAYGRAGARLRQPSRRASRSERREAAPRQPQPRQPQRSAPYRKQEQPPVRQSRGGNVINMPEREQEYVSPLPKTESLRTGTIIFSVRRKDDTTQIINYLIDGLNVILNFEEMDDAQCQRVLDMVSGASFALRGSIERISRRNYLVAPTGVEIVRPESAARASRQSRESSAGYGAW